MLDLPLELRRAWESALADLGLATDSAVLVGGPLADRIGEAVPIAIADEVPALVVLGPGPVLPDDATVTATGLDDESVDAVVMLRAWSDDDALTAVTREARRIVRPQGSVWLGRLDADAMLNSTSAARRSSLLYGRHPTEIAEALSLRTSVAPTELALVRAGFRQIESWKRNLPISVFGDVDSYLAAIESGLWFGIERITEDERSTLMADVRASLEGAEFPVVDDQPWILARGVKSG